jgi:tetratricopeptide (TPR) repeat protein
MPVAASLGQLDAATVSRQPGSPGPAAGELEELRRDWEENRSPIYAANLIDAALAYGLASVAEDAAAWVVANGGVSEVSIKLAKQLLSPTMIDQAAVTSEPTHQQRWRAVAGHRAALRRYPRDPLLWVELAREYSALGQIEPARRALVVAVSLAPDDRYVLRCASRFYLHARDPEHAHQILLRSSATLTDPWLMAAEIATADARGARSKLMKVGARAVESGRFAPRSISELAGAIGTVEFKSGNRKQTKRLFARALEDPTENTLAQAGWVSRHGPSLGYADSAPRVPRAFEANAWQAMAADDFVGAVEYSVDWLRDEPFASRPALLGSWIAAVALEDYETALRLVESAAVANPGDIRLTVQSLYCLASMGRVDEAAAQLPLLETAAASGDSTFTPPAWDVLLAADRGLLAFRNGNVEEGRAAYAGAIELAAANRLREAGASALINYIREEARIGEGPPVGAQEVRDVIGAFPQSHRGAILRFLGRFLPAV